MDNEAVTKQFLNYPRGIYIVVYDMQGGPLPQQLQEQLELAIIDVVSEFEGVAWTQKVE